jgi:anti-anti-sigma factor
MADQSIENTGQHCRVVLAGNLTASNVASIQAALKAQVELGVKEIEFDLHKTQVLDSSGIGLLIATHNSLARNQGNVRISNVSGDVLQLLQTMRLVNRLHVTPKSTEKVNHG